MKEFFWIIEFVATFIEFVVAYKFICLFLNKKEKKGTLILVNIISSLIVILVNQISLFSNIAIYFFTLFYTLIMIYITREKLYLVLSITAFYFIDVLIFVDVFSMFIGSIITQDESFVHTIIQGISMKRAFFILCVKFGQLGLYYLLAYFVKRNSLENAFRTYWFIFLFVSFVSSLSLNYFSNLLFSGFDFHVAITWLFFVVMFLLFLVTFVSYVKYQQSIEKKDNIELTNKLLQERYGNLKDIYDAEAKMSHDHRNDLYILKKYVNDQNNQAALAYMETLLKPINQAVNEVWTGNDIFDFILNCKKNEAKEKAVLMNIQANGVKITLSAKDINAIVANVLDNAIEASSQLEHGGVIWVTVKAVNSTLLVSVKNNHRNTLRKRSGKLLSSKNDKRRHGLGIEIIKSTVEKNGGFIETSYDDTSFQLLISLPMG